MYQSLTVMECSKLFFCPVIYMITLFNLVVPTCSVW